MPVQVRGLKELERAMTQLPINVAKKHLSASVREGAKLVRKEAKEGAPIDEGRLERNVFYFKIRARNTRHSVSYGVSVRTKGDRKSYDNAFYWWFVEFGTRFQAAQPFLRPAFERNKLRAIGIISRELGARIQMEAERL